MKFKYTITKRANSDLILLKNQIVNTLQRYDYNIGFISNEKIRFNSSGWGIGLRSQYANKITEGIFTISTLDNKDGHLIEMNYFVSYTMEIIFLIILLVAGFIGTYILSFDTGFYKYQAFFFIAMFAIFWTISLFMTKNGAENLVNEILDKASKDEK
ncbi:MAG: hypothetical protein H7289_16065 [Mucilaginibacter sp.]|nr:hypothetical protein [Mucilaginibacter sp.]